MPDDSKTVWITREDHVSLTQLLISPGLTSNPPLATTLRFNMRMLGDHLTTQSLSPLAAHIRKRVEFRALTLETEAQAQAQPNPAALELATITGAAMDERSRFYASLTSQSWSKEETWSKLLLCNNNDNKRFITNKRLAVAAYRRIHALPEREAVFFHRALIGVPAQPQPTPVTPFYDFAKLLAVLSALDKVAQYEQGKQFISSLLTVSADDSTDYKLVVFKQLLAGQINITDRGLDAFLFTEDHLIDMFDLAYSLWIRFNEHQLDPVVYASALMVLMSNYNCTEAADESTDEGKIQARQQARKQQARRATVFLETMAFIKQNDRDNDLHVALRRLLNDLFKTNDTRERSRLIIKHHSTVYGIPVYMISSILINQFKCAALKDRLSNFIKLFSGWFERCESTEGRDRALTNMREISKRESFLLAAEYVVFSERLPATHELNKNLHLLFHPDSALWCLPEEALGDIFMNLLDDTARSGNLLILLNSLAQAKKERIAPRLQKLGPDFLLFNQVPFNVKNHPTWLLTLLFILPNRLFDAAVSYLESVKKSFELSSKEKPRELTPAESVSKLKYFLNDTYAINRIPGLHIYLSDGQTQKPYYHASHPLDEIPGAELVTLENVKLPMPVKRIGNLDPNYYNLFSFLILLITTHNESHDREVHAVDLTAIVQFTISHATDKEFILYLQKNEIWKSDAKSVRPDKLILLDNYCRAQRELELVRGAELKREREQAQAARLEVLKDHWLKGKLNPEQVTFFQQAILSGEPPLTISFAYFQLGHRLAAIFKALDNLAQHEQGQRFMQMIFDVNQDGSTNYKLGVFKQLILGDTLTSTDYLDAGLFAGERMVEMFNTACSLHTRFAAHNFYPVVYASALLVLMSNFESTLPKRAAHTNPTQISEPASAVQARQVTIFLETMVSIQEKYPLDYMNLCQLLQTLLNDLYKANNTEIAKVLIRKHHYIVYTVGVYKISENKMRSFNRAVADVNLKELHRLLLECRDDGEPRASRVGGLVEGPRAVSHMGIFAASSESSGTPAPRPGFKT